MNGIAENRIEIKVDKKLNNLAGNRFGRQIYSEQIKEKVQENERNVVILPSEIEDVASSFIQGIYSEICEKYGREKAHTIMVLCSENQYVMEKINNSIVTYGI